MNYAALYHRPESEFAYLYTEDLAHIRLRTEKDDVASVEILAGDTYLHYSDEWFHKGLPMAKIGSTEVHDYWMSEVTVDTKRLAYAFKVTDADGDQVFYCDRGVFRPDNDSILRQVNAYFRLPYFHESDRAKTPEWVKNTVWYQIFPDRFANGDQSNDPVNTLPWGYRDHPRFDDFYGGDLQGIIDHLDDLVELGVNGLYLTPIFTGKTNHKYDTSDYMSIDPSFGDKKLLKNLVDQAHQRGMKVMLDAVFNHIGYYSTYWQDVLTNQENSVYRDWFHIRHFPVQAFNPVDYSQINHQQEIQDQLTYHTFAFEPHMPKFNTSNEAAKRYLLDVARYYIQEFDIDAWRLDVANEVDHQFWKAFHQACVSLKSDFYIIGEIWHSSQRFLEGDEFHGVMNYPMTDAIKDFFMGDLLSNQEMTIQQLVHRLTQQKMLYRMQTNQVQFNLLDSHDTMRLLTRANQDKNLVQASLAFMFLQQGTPCIYYGTEVGIDGGDDPDNRKCMIWNPAQQDQDMLFFTKKLVEFRKSYADMISYGELTWELVPENNRYLAMRLAYQGVELVAHFNLGQEPVLVRLEKGTKIVLTNFAIYEFEKILLSRGDWLICVDTGL